MVTAKKMGHQNTNYTNFGVSYLFRSTNYFRRGRIHGGRRLAFSHDDLRPRHS